MSSKFCPHCNCNTQAVKIGTTSAGRQRYKCRECQRTWTNKPRTIRLENKIWNDFVFRNLTTDSLANKYGFSKRKITHILRVHNVPLIVPPNNYPTKVICMDVTYVGRKYGFLSVLDAHTKKCLYCELTKSYESTYDYEIALRSLKTHGINPRAAVVDGKLSVIRMLEKEGLRVQMCQFHMLRAVNQYLTKRPVLDPNKELRNISLCLVKTKRKDFENMFYHWKIRHESWLQERYVDEMRRTVYSHQNTRTLVHAYMLFMKNLFIFQDYPELNIPNTNNLIEGVHSAIKQKLNAHRGTTKYLKTKIVRSFLSERTG